MNKTDLLDLLAHYDGIITTDDEVIHYTKHNVLIEHRENEITDDNKIVSTTKVRKVEVEFEFNFDRNVWYGAESSYEILGGFASPYLSKTTIEEIETKLIKFGFKRKEGEFIVANKKCHYETKE